MLRGDLFAPSPAKLIICTNDLKRNCFFEALKSVPINIFILAIDLMTVCYGKGGSHEKTNQRRTIAQPKNKVLL